MSKYGFPWSQATKKQRKASRYYNEVLKPDFKRAQKQHEELDFAQTLRGKINANKASRARRR